MATVHSLQARVLENGRTLYFVGYSFATRDGSPVRISRSISERVYDRLSEQATTRVVYMPSNPDNHYLPEITSPASTRFVFFIGGLLLAAAGFAEAQRRLHRRLVATGTAVAGFTADVRRRGGVRSFLVNYEVAGERRSVRGARAQSEPAQRAACHGALRSFSLEQGCDLPAGAVPRTGVGVRSETGFLQ